MIESAGTLLGLSNVMTGLRVRVTPGADPDTSAPILERLFRRHRPAHVVIERPFVGKSVRDAMTLNAGRAVCMLAAAASKARVFDYAPAQVKKAATGNGQATKEFVQRMVVTSLRLKETPPTDAADAIALGLCHVNRL